MGGLRTPSLAHVTETRSVVRRIIQPLIIAAVILVVIILFIGHRAGRVASDTPISAISAMDNFRRGFLLRFHATVHAAAHALGGFDGQSHVAVGHIGNMRLELWKYSIKLHHILSLLPLFLINSHRVSTGTAIAVHGFFVGASSSDVLNPRIFRYSTASFALVMERTFSMTVV